MSTTGKVKQNAEYYAIGHYGKVVQPNATRLVSSGDALKGVAFRNPDGSFAYLGVYYGKEDKIIRLKCGETVFDYTFRPGEVISFKW
ncbi:hypothetical protein SDC9_131641 [bioreactor metagenome]|uniref:Uncharacterized protein n=1 Tax=bioreactor metagenome TaxID=1076179 RepID=A0A645D672_9ZZZZ